MNKDEQILIVSDFTYPNYAGGISRHVYDVFTCMLNFNYPVKLISRKKKDQSPYSITDQTFNIEIKTDEHRLDLSLIDILSFSRIKEVLIVLYRSEKLIFHYPVLGFVLMLAAKIMKKRVIYFFHGPYDLEYMNKSGKSNRDFGVKIRYILQFLSIRLSDMVLYHSEYMKTKLMRFNPNESKIKYVPPYVDHRKFNLNPPETDIHKIYGFKNSVKLIITTRRLTHRTGVIKFIEIYQRIRANIQFETILLVGGIGEQYEAAKAYEDEHVRVLGWINEGELSDYLKSSDLYVLPSLDLEGFGYVVLEALASGLPVIASETAGGGTEFLKTIDDNLIFKFNEQDILKALNYALIQTEATNYREKFYNFTTRYSLINLCKEYFKV